jgi:hypothetical protein
MTRPASDWHRRHDRSPSDGNKPEETQMDRTVAVTGGSGKLGRAVVAALIEEGGS